MKKKLLFLFATCMIVAASYSQAVIHDITGDTNQQNITQAKQQVQRTTPFGVSLSYQPAIGGDFFGIGLYIDNFLGPVGVYGSMTGLRTVIQGTRETIFNVTDSYVGYTVSSKDWYPLNFGLTLQTAANFFLYCGFSTGGYSEWITQNYTHTNAGQKPQPYTIVTEEKSTNPGVDFGAKYYAGKGTVRFGLQLGFNTSMKAILAGIQIGLFVK